MGSFFYDLETNNVVYQPVPVAHDFRLRMISSPGYARLPVPDAHDFRFR